MLREDLIKLVKELSEIDDLSSRAKDVAFVKREANRISKMDEDSLAQKDQNEEFFKYYDLIAKKEGNIEEALIKEKKDLIAKAQALVTAKDFKKANDDMTAIFDEFKKTGYTTKAQDDALWTELKAARSEFNKARREHFDNLRASINANKEGKEAIIAKAKEVATLENIVEAGKQMTSLMDEWKKLGYAGKEFDDALWNEFNALRQEVYSKRKEHFAELEKTFAERVEKKNDLIKQAHVVLANSAFTKEEIETLKQLRAEWKEVGFAGKDKDNALYEEFNSTINKYFAELKESHNDK